MHDLFVGLTHPPGGSLALSNGSSGHLALPSLAASKDEGEGGHQWSGCSVRIRLQLRLPHSFHHLLSIVGSFSEWSLMDPPCGLPCPTTAKATLQKQRQALHTGVRCAPPANTPSHVWSRTMGNAAVWVFCGCPEGCCRSCVVLHHGLAVHSLLLFRPMHMSVLLWGGGGRGAILGHLIGTRVQKYRFVVGDCTYTF